MQEKQKEKLIVIVGQTSVGKSDFAVTLARKFDGEVISADSRQVYRGTDLLAGTITCKEMKGIPHHLLSYADIKRQYSVSRFLRDAKKEIRSIHRRDKTIIICGGTAMYIDALIYGQIFPEVKPNTVLRKELSKLSPDELLKRLQALDKRRAETIDTQNPRRLVRAIEIATALGSVPEIQYSPKEYEALIIGLARTDDELKERIKLRIEKRMKRGMQKETQSLLDSGVSRKRLHRLGLEFDAMTKLIEKSDSREHILERLYFDIWHYAQRQKRWWKRDGNIIWLKPDELQKAFTLVLAFLRKE